MTFVAPPGYQPVYNPRIPYLGPIHGGLREGMSIYIQGSIPKDISRFHVNLRCNESASGDIALHFNPRFDGLDKVVFNSYRNGSWESEEKVRSMPFTAGQAFETVIGVGAHGYEVRVNGKDFHTFKHRLPVKEVRGIQVEGDVSIQSITVIGVSLPPAVHRWTNLLLQTHVGLCFQAVPFSTMIHGGMHPKKTFIIRGRVPSGADRCVSVTCMTAVGSGNTALHLNPRVKAGEVVRNSRIGGDWGKEERGWGQLSPPGRHSLAVIGLGSSEQVLYCQGIFLSLSSRSSKGGSGVRVGVESRDACRGSVAVDDDTGMSRLSRESERVRLVSCWGQRT
uniref:Galectin n=1 Tax=Oryzias latipes TaxID=8090 RepID=A0A3P9HJT2_ORYLA